MFPLTDLQTTPVPPRQEDWLDKEHVQYVGNYYHKLLGFYNVTYPVDVDERGSTKRQLRFQSGSIGEGYLQYVDGIKWNMVYDGPLAYFGQTGPYRDLQLPIRFHGLDKAKLINQHTAVEVIPYEPMAPPFYKRRPLAVNSSSRGTTNTILILFLASELTAFCWHN